MIVKFYYRAHNVNNAIRDINLNLLAFREQGNFTALIKRHLIDV